MPEVIPYIGRLFWQQQPVGTAFLVHDSGLIATCYHVVRVAGESPENQHFIFEFLQDRQSRRVVVTGYLDPEHDIALLQMNGPIPKGVAPAVLVESAATRSGMNFQVIGFGDFNDPAHQYRYSSATGGIVGPTERDGVDLLQLESKQVLRGMSGGPVITDTLKGVVGLVSARYNIDPRTDTWMRDTVWAARSEDIATLHPDLKVVKPWPTLVRWAVWLSALLVIVLGSFAAWQWFQPVETPPEGGFNVLVAEFATLDETGHPAQSEAGKEISTTVYQIIKSATDKLPAAMQPNIWGPEKVPQIEGADPESRASQAAAIAKEYHATILIYGVVRSNEKSQQVELAFEIPAESFNYGSEIIGSNRLGQPIDLEPNPQANYQANITFDARTQALKYLVTGLAYFSINEYERAVVEFRAAADLKDWKKGEGKEVAYMFIGSTLLRDYDPKTGPPQNLVEARQAFLQARDEHPDYARAYLGLGAVAREEALLNASEICSGEVEAGKLAEAEQWYHQSLAAADQPPNAFIPTKANYGFGQIQLLLYCNQFEGHEEAKQKSQDYFTRVIQDYEQAGKPVDLAWFAGHAYTARGWLYTAEQNWTAMAADTEKGIAILSEMPGQTPQVYLARNWALKGFAEKKLCNLEAARNSYQQALIQAEEAGFEKFDPKEFVTWQNEYDLLEQMIEGGISCE